MNTCSVVAFSHLSLQPFQQCFTTANIQSFGHFKQLELPLSSYCDVALLAGNSKLVENFDPSTRFSGDSKENLSANIKCMEYARDFCHDRKSALTNLEHPGFSFSHIRAPQNTDGALSYVA